MSPTSTSSSTIYDHLMINFQQQPKTIMRNDTDSSTNIYDNSNKFLLSNSKPDSNKLLLIKKTQSLPVDEQQQRAKRRYTITHMTIPEPITRCSVSNQAYEKAVPRKSQPTANISSTLKEMNVKYLPKPLSSNIEVKPMDFRPLIINGRRRFNTISSGTPMVIIKKKSPSPMNTISFDQKPMFRSIPVNISSSKTAMVVSTVIPSSLSSYSSCCSSSTGSTSLTNVGTVSVPIQVIKTQKSNNNTISTSTTTTTTSGASIESQKGYRYTPKQSQPRRSLLNLTAGKRIEPLPILSDDDESTKMPSSSSGDGDGNSHHSTVMADSNVLRLIRRYDPVAANNVGIRSRRSLENTRSASHATTSKPIPSLSSNISSSSCSYLPQQTSYPLQEDIRSIRHSLTPRLQRQKSIHEPDLLPESNETKTSIQPILKYTPPTSRAALNIQPKKTEPLSIEIEPHVPSIAAVNESSTPYQPLITTGTKRVCAAISKSEWNLRLQQDPPFPILSPSTPPTESVSPPKTIDQPPPPPPSREKESYRPLFNRSKSTMEVHSQNDQDHEMDDFDENSAPINSGSCVGKLKQLFNTKPSTSPSNASLNKQNRMDSLDSSLNRRLHTHGTNQNTSDVPSSPIIFNQQIPHQTQSTSNGNLTKPTTIVQDVTPTTASPLLKRPILRSQKTLDSTESLNRLNQNQTMPTSDLAYDVYHFRRLNDPEPITPATRLRNIAKVEPYSINTNMVRPLYQSSSLSQPTSTIVSSKAHTIPNSTGNTPTNSSTSSSAASLGGTIRHPNIRHSDFLIPNPSYSSAPPPPPPPTSLHVTQSLSNSSSYATPPPPPLSTSILLSESLSQGSANRLPSNTSLHNGRSTGLIHSTNNSPPKYQSTTQGDFYPGKRTYSPSTYHNGHGSSMNNSLYTKFDNNPAPSSYHYRPKEFASSNIPTNSPLLNNGRPSSQGQMRSRPVEQQPHDDRMAGGGQQHQSRRRFQRRKQMKRSKSADLYQDLSSTSSRNPNTNNYLYDSNRHHESNRSQQSISRDLPGGGGGDGHYSSSSSSTSIGDIERTNRAALLRYKSLDSVTFNNKKSNLNGKPTNRKQLSKSIHMDFDSDDSVCGIPKPRKTHGR